MIERECRSCGDTYEAPNSKSSRLCRPCRSKDTMQRRRDNWPQHKSTRLMYKYGIDWDTYTQMGEAQDWKCACCSAPSSTDKHGYPVLCVDHNHTSGAVRGLLCDFCNKAIGLMKESPDILQNAISYLEKYQEKL